MATNKGKPLIFRGQRRRHLLVAGWRNRRFSSPPFICFMPCIYSRITHSGLPVPCIYGPKDFTTVGRGSYQRTLMVVVTILARDGIQRLHLFAPGSKICALYPSHSLLQLSTLRVVILPLATEDDFSTSNPRLLGLLVVTELTFIPMYKGLIT
ncbi:hypothetical protein Lal_00001263 [Lupinus albus]|nr:hypothetical protein Lal_00001263 [Lupinus albus]